MQHCKTAVNLVIDMRLIQEHKEHLSRIKIWRNELFQKCMHGPEYPFGNFIEIGLIFLWVENIDREEQMRSVALVSKIQVSEFVFIMNEWLPEASFWIEAELGAVGVSVMTWFTKEVAIDTA